MATLENPQIEIKIYDTIPYSITDLDIEIDITKDVTEEPNLAEITIWNLNTASHAKLAQGNIQSIPIEIFLTDCVSGLTSLAFAGEIDSVTRRYERFPTPGYETSIIATSQKANHDKYYFQRKTYQMGTPEALIIADLIGAVGLPVVYETDLPKTAILISHSFSGPAFPLLRSFCLDKGIRAYINDGTLHIMPYMLFTASAPTASIPVPLLSQYMTQSPVLTTRVDSQDIEMRTVIDTVAIDPFKRAPKKTKSSKKKYLPPFDTPPVVPELGDYASYEAVDATVNGVDFELFCHPDIQPYNLVSVVDLLDFTEKLYRVYEVRHYGDNFGGDLTTSLKTDDYELDLI